MWEKENTIKLFAIACLIYLPCVLELLLGGVCVCLVYCYVPSPSTGLIPKDSEAPKMEIRGSYRRGKTIFPLPIRFLAETPPFPWKTD